MASNNTCETPESSSSYWFITPLVTSIMTAGTIFMVKIYLNHRLLRNKKQDEEGVEEDLTDPFVLLCKLVRLGEVIERQTDSSHDDLPYPSVVAVLAAGRNLYLQLEELNPRFRADRYESSTTRLPLSEPRLEKEELETVKDHLKYADWAYETDVKVLQHNLEQDSFTLLRHDAFTEPGRVAHYVALDDDRKICLIGLKGSSTLSDLLTDVVLNTVEHVLEAGKPFSDAYTSDKIHCHEGILAAAVTMADSVTPMLEKLFLPLHYRVVLCGHSLGAGTACLLGLLLRSRIPALRDDRNLHVYAYAPPAVLNYTACAACLPFVTSVVDNSDVVPRISVANLVVMDKYFVTILERLKEHNLLLPVDLAKAAVFGENDSDCTAENLLLSETEIDAFLADAIGDDALLDADNVYVPGRVVLLYRTHDNSVGGVATDGGCAPLRFIELANSLLLDHTTGSYKAILDEVSVGLS